MATGCQGPFCHGTGGWCGCNCKCCPPPCCPVVSVSFQCVENPPCEPTCCDLLTEDDPATPPKRTVPSELFVRLVCDCDLGDASTLAYEPGSCPSGTCRWNADAGGRVAKVECNDGVFTATFVANDIGPISVVLTVLSCDPLHLYADGFEQGLNSDAENCNQLPGSFTNPCVLCISETEDDFYNNCGLSGMRAALHRPPQPMPTFDRKPIMSKNRRFLFGGPFPTSTSLPIQPFCIPLVCGVTGGAMAAFGDGPFGAPLPGPCCFEILDGIIVAVGNGWVNAPASIAADNGCVSYNVFLNGMKPPIWVNDCETITVTVSPVDDCCVCELIDIKCGPCDGLGMLYAPSNRLWKKVVSNTNKKVKINPETGLPYIYIDKAELLRRIVARRQHLRRRKQ